MFVIKQRGEIEMGKGYELADGTFSSEYKLGDKFEVVDGYIFSIGSIVTLFDDDGSDCPLLKLEKGSTNLRNAGGEMGGYCCWSRLKAYKPQQDVSTFTKAAFVKADLKDGMVVTYRNEWERIVYKGELVWGAGKGSKLEYFKDNLLHINEEQMDIVKVMFGGELLWEREASPTEVELKQQRITKELEFAEAKRERLNAHIERLKGNFPNYNLE